MAEKRETLNPIKLTHDWWDNDGNRHGAGTVVEMNLADAKAILASGKGLRADPLPGEK